MPRTKSGVPFVTKDIAKAFFELDLSGNGPSIAGKAPEPRNRSRPVASPAPTTNEVKGNSAVSFLTIPVEIRLQIYDELLVSRFNRKENPSWAVGNTDQKLVLLHMIQARQYRTMEPGILQTCKQIFHEANSILYSKNIFAISEPEEMFRLTMQIGFANLRLIKTLQIWVPYMAKLSPWLQLFYMLANEASGLRYIELTWGVDLERMNGRGLGDNLDFVRALGEIQGLEKLVIQGYYAKNWPAYLNERMGAQVQAICGHCREEPEMREGDLNNDALEHLKWVRELNETEMQAFRKYQQGTEDLIP